jgi:NADPH:quinone reductase-like Zn-dependent oxidoreductase
MNRNSEAIHKYDGPEVLQYEDAPRPKPKPGELLIHVHAAGGEPYRLESS